MLKERTPKQNLDAKTRCDQWLTAQDLFMKDAAAIPIMIVQQPLT